MTTTKIIFAIFLSAILGGVVAVVGFNYVNNNNIIKTAPAIADTYDPENTDLFAQADRMRGNKPGIGPGFGVSYTDTEEEIVQSIYEKVSPSVVNITTRSISYDPRRHRIQEEGKGSGVVVDKNGYILTNFHVVRNSLSRGGELYVTFSDGESEEGEIIGYDVISDLAVIKLKDSTSRILPVAPFGNSDSLMVGSRAIAIGNPFGFSGTCTVGVISALNRTVEVSKTQIVEGLIQTDATINPGNSGGPLINSSGEVIGINSVIYSKTGSNVGLGFAIPINDAKKIMEDLIQYGKVYRPYTGIITFPFGPSLAEVLNLPVRKGLFVHSVEPDSPASKMGIKGGVTTYSIGGYGVKADGDIITALNGEQVSNPYDFQKRIFKMNIGDKIVLDIVRGKEKLQVEIILETRE